MIVILMGVSGSGKTDVGEALSRKLGWRFIDADDHHPAANVAKMKAGTPLDDEDRLPWLQKLNLFMKEEEEKGESVMLACSALKEAYRRRLAQGLSDVRIVYLKGSFEVIQSRIAKRTHKYMPASLLQSQFDTLEPPGDAITVDVAPDVETIVAAIAARLAR